MYILYKGIAGQDRRQSAQEQKEQDQRVKATLEHMIAQHGIGTIVALRLTPFPMEALNYLLW